MHSIEFARAKFPDGTPIPDWFGESEIVNIENLNIQAKNVKIETYGAQS
ncbi:MAG: hypothetical protein LBG96_10675 [Tannerella sp.]|nr:hypothetical protein [Tannerella sp.]